MISPSVGRVVLFRPAGSDPAAQPHAATVAFVHNDRLVNLAIVNENGSPYARQSVILLQDDDAPPPSDIGYAEWMAYQKGQAAKAEAAEGGLGKQVTDLASDVDAKFASLGDWLTPALKSIEDRVTALSTPAQAPPANPPEADTGGVGAAPQAQA